MCISLQSYQPGTRISTSLYNENLVLFLFIGWILWFGFFFLLTNDVAPLNVCKLTPMVLELIAHWDKFWLNFMSAFYILSIAYLSDIWFTDISPVFFLMEYFEVKRFFFILIVTEVLILASGLSLSNLDHETFLCVLVS